MIITKQSYLLVLMVCVLRNVFLALVVAFPRGPVQATTADGDASVISVEDFTNPRHKWKEMNDPVMGGKSTGTFAIENGVGAFLGEVVDVPFLQAPGFIQARTVDRAAHYPDLRACQGLQLTLTSDHPEYQGYRFSFGHAHPPDGKFFAFGYKTSFQVAAADSTTTQQTIVLPFHGFTDLWDDATGEPIQTCQDAPQYCPTPQALQRLGEMAVWAEGVAGSASLHLHSIAAYGCAAEATKASTSF